MRWAVDLILTKKLWMLLWCTHSYQGGTFNPLISFPQNIDLVDNFCVIIYHVATPATFVFDVVSHTHYINVVVSRIFSVFYQWLLYCLFRVPALEGLQCFRCILPSAWLHQDTIRYTASCFPDMVSRSFLFRLFG